MDGQVFPSALLTFCLISLNGLERKLEAGSMIFLLSSDDASEGWLVLPAATIISLLPMVPKTYLNHDWQFH